MKKSLLVRLAMLLLTISTLSGCFWRAENDGNHEDNGNHVHERDRGVNGEHREDNADHR